MKFGFVEEWKELKKFEKLTDEERFNSILCRK